VPAAGLIVNNVTSLIDIQQFEQLSTNFKPTLTAAAS